MFCFSSFWVCYMPVLCLLIDLRLGFSAQMTTNSICEAVQLPVISRVRVSSPLTSDFWILSNFTWPNMQAITARRNKYTVTAHVDQNDATALDRAARSWLALPITRTLEEQIKLVLSSSQVVGKQLRHLKHLPSFLPHLFGVYSKVSQLQTGKRLVCQWASTCAVAASQTLL